MPKVGMSNVSSIAEKEEKSLATTKNESGDGNDDAFEDEETRKGTTQCGSRRIVTRLGMVAVLTALVIAVAYMVSSRVAARKAEEAAESWYRDVYTALTEDGMAIAKEGGAGFCWLRGESAGPIPVDSFNESSIVLGPDTWDRTGPCVKKVTSNRRLPFDEIPICPLGSKPRKIYSDCPTKGRMADGTIGSNTSPKVGVTSMTNSLKGNKGHIPYSIPDQVGSGKYAYAWCKAKNDGPGTFGSVNCKCQFYMNDMNTVLHDTTVSGSWFVSTSWTATTPSERCLGADTGRWECVPDCVLHPHYGCNGGLR